MRNTESIFEDRKRELELYYSVMFDIDTEKPTIKTFDNSMFFKILKSNFILMLYNLIEACVVSGIMEIYEKLRQEGCTYNDVIEEIKSIWRSNQISKLYTQPTSKSTYDSRVKQMIDDITADAPIMLTRDMIRGSGNLDDKTIMSLCDKHRIRYIAKGNRQKLRVIKQKRNNLAHGDVSFSDCARDFTLSDLNEIMYDVIQFMQSIIDGMKEYYDKRGYRIISASH